MFARTPRLLLRPGWAEDAPALAAAIGDEAVVRNLATAPWPYGPGEAAAFLALTHDPALPNFLMFQRTGGAPRLIGGCGISPDPDGDPELGYWIARPFWGLGFATEAARHLVAIARALKLPRLTAGHFADNPASGRVLHKAGFRPTGQIAQRFSMARGGSTPTVMFAEESDAGEGGGDADLPTDMREAWRLLAA
jgi:RimJ/RimL family protein N-acetyltransferase